MREYCWVLVSMTVSAVINIANSATTGTTVGLGGLVVNRMIMHKVWNVTGKQNIE